MKKKIVLIEQGTEGVSLPEEYLRFLELIPGAEVEVTLDKANRRMIISPVHGEDFIERFKETMESMA